MSADSLSDEWTAPPCLVVQAAAVETRMSGQAGAPPTVPEH